MGKMLVCVLLLPPLLFVSLASSSVDAQIAKEQPL